MDTTSTRLYKTILKESNMEIIPLPKNQYTARTSVTRSIELWQVLADRGYGKQDAINYDPRLANLNDDRATCPLCEYSKMVEVEGVLEGKACNLCPVWGEDEVKCYSDGGAVRIWQRAQRGEGGRASREEIGGLAWIVLDKMKDALKRMDAKDEGTL